MISLFAVIKGLSVNIPKTEYTFGTTVNTTNIISLLLAIFFILKVESGAIRKKGLKSIL